MMRRKKNTEPEVVASTLEEVRAEFERAKGAIVERRHEGHQLGRQFNAAQAEERAAREALTRAFADDADTDAALKRVERATAEAARPWDEMNRAAALKVKRAEGDVARYVADNRDALWSEYRPRAIAGAQTCDDAIKALVAAIKALDALESQADELLRWQGEQTVGRVPLRGLEALGNDLRRRNTTVPPIPRELAPRVFEAESSARAVWQFADADVLAAAGRTPAVPRSTPPPIPQEPGVVTIKPPAGGARGGQGAA
ncbi:MAG: hypothetical protein ACR2ML_12110 [Solirubrobacteraceae bacterium]